MIILQPKTLVFMGNPAKEAASSLKILSVIKQLDIPDDKIVKMPFILTAPVSTEELIKLLQKLSGVGLEIW